MPAPVDPRPAAAAALLLMAFTELGLMAFNPHLATQDLFKSITQGTWSGVVLAVAGYYFGSSHRDPPAPPPGGPQA